MIRRINIWGGPGSGKSTTATWLFSHLKMLGHDIQFVEEFVKRWAYQKRPILSFDQMYLTATQINTEDEYLRGGVKHIITDSPIALSYFFAKKCNIAYAHTLLDMETHFEKTYPSLNIYLKREVPYQINGRYETEEEAQKLSDEQLAFLMEKYPDLIITSPLLKEEILKMLDDTLRRSVSNQSE